MIFGISYFNIFSMFLWVVIIPEWLIKVPGHIAMMFWWFLELPKIDQKSINYGPSDPVFITKILQTNQEKYGTIWEKYFSHLNILEIQTFPTVWHHRAPSVWDLCFRFLDQKQLVSPSVFNKNLKIRWWNLSKSWLFVDNPKTKWNLPNQTYFWKRTDYFP